MDEFTHREFNGKMNT